MPFQLSPGVAVVEKDFTSIVPAVSSSIGAFAGAFQWGPVMEPATVSSENELVRRFGKPNDSNADSFFTAANFLSYTNNLLLVRADSNHINAVASPTGGVASASVGTAGAGYVSTAAAPGVTIGAPNVAGGIQAEGTAILSGGGVSSVSVNSGGVGYGSVPSVQFTNAVGDTGSGATATAVLGTGGTAGQVVSITINNPGTGYRAAPTVQLTGVTPSGSAASLGVPVISTSTITGITITQAGTGYTSAPNIGIAAPPSGTTANGTATLASSTGVKVKSATHYLASFSNGEGLVGEFAAKYPGTLGNNLKVSMCDSAFFSAWAYKDQFDSAPSTSSYAASVAGVQDEMHIVVVDEDGGISGTAGTVLEKFAFVSKASDAKLADGTNNYYKSVINSKSAWIWWMDHSPAVSTGTAWGSAAAAQTFKLQTSAYTASLSGGTDDYAVSDANKILGYALFANAEQYDISLLLGGKASTTVALSLIGDIAETRLDCVAFISPQNTSSGDPIIGSTSTEVTAITTYRDALPSTSYAVLDSGYKYQYDRYNDKYRFIPLNADIAGLCARTDYTNDPWWSPGGLNRGQIKNVVRLAFNPSKTQRDTLYKSGVNPVVAFPGEGTVLFGDKTLLKKPSAFDRINVRRLFIVMEKAIATAAKYQLFEFNDPFTRAQFKNLVEPFLRDVQGRRGITEFVVKCDESNNTGQVIDSNEFVADIFVKPNRSINYITLNFVAARSGINFTEVGA
jgi:phage tail sheath protein FI